ncbi:MAG: hypothetical protein ACFFF4_11525 [Candidatus Thorarchaeota archaeon]
MNRGIKMTFLSILVVSFILPMLPVQVEAVGGSWVNQFTMDNGPIPPVLWYGYHRHLTTNAWRCGPGSNNWILQHHGKNIKVSNDPAVTNVRVMVLMKQWNGEAVDITITSSSGYPAYYTSRLEYTAHITLTSSYLAYTFEIGTDCKGRYISFNVDMDDCESGFYFNYQHPILQIYTTNDVPW